MAVININYCVETAFIAAMADAGIETHQELTIESDGQLHRFRVNGDKSGSKNGWYVLFNDDLAAGSFGSWKTGVTSSWCAKKNHKLSKKERHALRLQHQSVIQIREQQRTRDQHNIAVKCGQLWNNASPMVKANHPYLLNKQIKAYGIRQLGNSLVIPIQNAQNYIVSLQFIMPDGRKTFKSGGKVKGGFMVIGELKGTVYICEGYATGATIYQATKKGVIVAFNAANLLPVVEGLKANGFDHLKIIVAADNDSENKVNTGLEKGKECAYLHDLALIYPLFTGQQKGTDFNDLISSIGFDEVARCLINAMGDMD